MQLCKILHILYINFKNLKSAQLILFKDDDKTVDYHSVMRTRDIDFAKSGKPKLNKKSKKHARCNVQHIHF